MFSTDISDVEVDRDEDQGSPQPTYLSNADEPQSGPPPLLSPTKMNIQSIPEEDPAVAAANHNHINGISKQHQQEEVANEEGSSNTSGDR